MTDKTEQLRQYLLNIMGGHARPEAAEGLPIERMLSPLSESAEEIDLALGGVNEVLSGNEITAEQSTALEAIVLPQYRPAVDIINDSFHEPPYPWKHLGQGEIFQRIRAAIPSVGRVEVPNHPMIPYAGTAFVVGPDLMMTNRHVAEIFTSGVGIKELYFRSNLNTSVDFKQEVIPAPPILVQVQEVRMIHPYWDCALFKVNGIPPERKHLILEGQEPSKLKDREVVIIGYPAQDSRNDIALQNRIFNGIFQRKRMQPGKLMGYEAIDSFENTVEALTHDSSTLGGNSGSAIIDLETGRVIGLHFAGLYLKANYAVPSWELARDQRVLDANVSFHNAPAAGSVPWENRWKDADPEGEAGEDFSINTPDMPQPTGEVRLADWFELTTDAELMESLDRDRFLIERRLIAVLGEAEAKDLIDELDSELQEGKELFGFPSPDPALPEIIFINGIMGAHLANRWGAGQRLWFSLRALLAGNMAEKLSLKPDGVTDATSNFNLGPDGILRMSYGKAARKWRKQRFIVHEFPFDWRKSLAMSADRLNGFIEQLAVGNPNRRFALVAHSMGGLVASLYSARHAKWTDRVQKAIFAGTPLGGSFAPVEAVLGSYPFFKALAMLSRKDDIADLQDLSAALPGLLDMLPSPALFKDADQLYWSSCWPERPRPAQRYLDAGRAIKSQIAGSPIMSQTTGIVCRKFGTVSSVTIENRGLIAAGPATGQGDGTVPIRASAIVDLCELYEATGYRHSDLFKSDEVIQAVADILRSGSTSSLSRLRREDIDFDAVLPEPEFPIITETVGSGIQLRFNEGRLSQKDIAWILDPMRGTPPR